MSESKYEVTLALLAATIKEYGTDNVLAIHDHELKNPIEIKIDHQSGTDEARLVLLEGQEAINAWREFSTTTVEDYIKENV